tara:strand:- start:72 stop:227 length:156 start_codon:yes stop_codon:yes gene_type:complete
MITENRYSRIFHHINIKDVRDNNYIEPEENYVNPEVVDIPKSNWRDDMTEV